ncbi:MAG: hypothetical protein IPP33_04115 [Flavobacteriales bacterium]|nr:hypothetical protein [Flavobacteriales bacterium]
MHPTSILHNPFFTGNLLHVAYYYDGYWLWDTTDPLQPTLLGFYDTCVVPNTDNYRGAWGTYPFLPSGHVLVSDMQTGLWVLDVDYATDISNGSIAPGFRIAPTITNGAVRITPLMNSSATTRIDVVASSGQLLSSRSVVGSYELDLSGLNDGLYLVPHQIAQRSSHNVLQRPVVE